MHADANSRQNLKVLNDFSITFFGLAVVRQFEQMVAQGELVVELTSEISERALDLADDTTDRALEVVAEVKTADYADNLKAISFMVMAFAAVAIYLTKD